MKPYQAGSYKRHLQPGESVPVFGNAAVMNMPAESSRIVPIKSGDGVVGQSVILDMEPGGVIPPVVIVAGGVEFTVRTLEGAGTLFVQKVGEAAVQCIALVEGQKHTLQEGDAYGYVSEDVEEGWRVHDKSNVPFESWMERSIGEETPALEGGCVLRAIQNAHRQQKARLERDGPMA